MDKSVLHFLHVVQRDDVKLPAKVTKIRLASTDQTRCRLDFVAPPFALIEENCGKGGDSPLAASPSSCAHR